MKPDILGTKPGTYPGTPHPVHLPRILQAIKNWSRGRPGNEATPVHLTRYTSPGTPPPVHLTRYTSPGTPHPVHLTRYTSPGTPHPVHLTRYTSPGTPHPVHLTQYTSPGTPPPIHLTRTLGPGFKHGEMIVVENVAIQQQNNLLMHTCSSRSWCLEPGSRS